MPSDGWSVNTHRQRHTHRNINYHELVFLLHLFAFELSNLLFLSIRLDSSVVARHSSHGIPHCYPSTSRSKTNKHSILHKYKCSYDGYNSQSNTNCNSKTNQWTKASTFAHIKWTRECSTTNTLNGNRIQITNTASTIYDDDTEKTFGQR